MQLIKSLIFFKTKYPAIWSSIEFLNGMAFKYLYRGRIVKNADNILKNFENEEYSYRFLTPLDIEQAIGFFQKQNLEQFKYFKPHEFDKQTIKRLFKNPAFLLLGVFDQNKMIGYFLLRCFINKECFTGRIVDEQYQGQGIAKKMGKILLHIAWSSGFRVFGTASTENIKSLKSYQAINNYRIIKELDNNYIYFEYLRSEEKQL